MLNVTREQTRLYAVRFGLVNQPQPRGAFKPRLCRANRAGDVRAAIIFLREGVRRPNFMVSTMVLVSHGGEHQRITA